jgi:hypothetical protein
MYDESVDDNSSYAAPMEARLTRALERVPKPLIAADFAARVAAQAPARVPVAVTPTYYGRTAVVIGMVVLFVALVVFAPRTVGNSTFWLAMEWVLCAQFVGLGVWLGVRRWELS